MEETESKWWLGRIRKVSEKEYIHTHNTLAMCWSEKRVVTLEVILYILYWED